MISPLSMSVYPVPGAFPPPLALGAADARRQKPSASGFGARIPELIVKKISYDGRTEYLVKWLGLPNSCNTWECTSKTPSIVPLIEALDSGAMPGTGAASSVATDSCTMAGSISTVDDRITPCSSRGPDSVGMDADFGALDVSGNAAAQALLFMTSNRTPSPAEYQQPGGPAWSHPAFVGAMDLAAPHTATKRVSNKPPSHGAQGVGDKPKPRRRANSHGSMLHDIGTHVVITTDKEHVGAAAYVSKVPVHPSTWYEVTLNHSGHVLKLRSSSFRVLEGDSPTSMEKRPLEIDACVAPKVSAAASAGMHAVSHANKKPRTPKMSLPELGQQVIITGDKGGRQGQRGCISRTPDHPSTWYELTLNDGEILKLRSTSFTTNLDWTTSSDEDDQSPASALPAQRVNKHLQRLKEEDAMSDSEGGEEDAEDDDGLEGTPCC